MYIKSLLHSFKVRSLKNLDKTYGKFQFVNQLKKVKRQLKEEKKWHTGLGSFSALCLEAFDPNEAFDPLDCLRLLLCILTRASSYKI